LGWHMRIHWHIGAFGAGVCMGSFMRNPSSLGPKLFRGLRL
jgi:hypothetical protein